MRQWSCQDFKQGCCGCCVNTRWNRGRIERYLMANTVAMERILEKRENVPRLRDLLLIHLLRGGLYDYCLAFILVPFTVGLSALIWKKWFGSCCYAGFINKEEQRVGCLIHPLRIGGSFDWRRRAYWLVPTLKCDREMICPALRNHNVALDLDWYDVSCACAREITVHS